MRTKLAALALAPMLALGALIGLVVVDRLSAARRAGEVRTVVDLAAQVAPVIEHLQRERSVVGARLFTNDAATTSRYELEGAITDKAVTDFEAGVAALRDEVGTEWSGTDIGRAVIQAKSLPALREEVADHAVTSLEAQAEYTEAIDRFLAVGERIANATGDPTLAERGAASLAAARTGEEVAKQSAVLGGAYAAGSLDRSTLVALSQSRQAEQIHLAELRRAATSSELRTLDSLLGDVSVVAADRMRDEAIAGGDSVVPGVAGIWRDSVARKRDGLQRLGDSIRLDLVQRAAAREDSGRREAIAYAGAAGILLLVMVALVALLARSIVRPMRRLTEAASEVAERLPHVVEALARPGADAVKAPEPISVAGPEMGQLADAFNNVHHVAIEVAGEQAALRAGIGEMFTNVARRTQALVERQLGFIDSLEHEERDPDALQNLFRLDHLATRMRRNAESLLVLAGAETPRRWREPVLLRDVVRAAAGEVEDFARVNVADTGWLALPGPITAGAVHLLAELIDNACHFSPPDTPVDVRVTEVDDHYAVTIHDRGLGMSDEALAAANEKLARPPLLEAAVTGQLGLFVVGRIAGRLDVKVRLTRSPWGGVSAHLFLPSRLVLVAPPESAEAATVAPAAPAPSLPAFVPANPSAAPVGPAAGAPVAAVDPVARTSSGLARRVPRTAGAPAPAGAGAVPPAAPPSAPAANLSPDHVQAAMARFQSGLARGRAAAANRDADDATPGDER